MNDEEKTTSIGVSIELLDTLMNLAGELVLSRNQLLQGLNTANHRGMEVSCQRIDLITSELQEAIMRTRMQPMANLLNTFDDLVRDLSRQLGKSIHLVVKGKEVELDKTILESMKAPLTGLVKNAVENGIEFPDEREKAGKPRTAVITLKAFHDAGQLNIIISDDGAGVAAEQMTRLGGILPQIETLGGVLEIDSKASIGTDIQIKLPLTLAIIPSQITSVGNERYAIPQVNLNELLRIPAGQVKNRIEKVGDAEVVRLRGELLPLLNLANMLGIEKRYSDPANGMAGIDRRKNIADRRSKQHLPSGESRAEMDATISLQQRNNKDRRAEIGRPLNIAVVSSGAYKYGLLVDQLHDSEEIVVKPMGRHLKQYLAFAGATIMGDGKVALILDIGNLAQIAQLSTASALKKVTSKVEARVETGKIKTAMLTFKIRENEHFALPLEHIDRIERVEASAIEEVGGRKVIQYRGGALRLCELSEFASVSPLSKKENQEILVFKTNKSEMGLMVNPPLDTLEVFLDIDETTLSQPAISGSTIINDRTMLVVDVPALAGLVR